MFFTCSQQSLHADPLVGSRLGRLRPNGGNYSRSGWCRSYSWLVKLLFLWFDHSYFNYKLLNFFCCLVDLPDNAFDVVETIEDLISDSSSLLYEDMVTVLNKLKVILNVSVVTPNLGQAVINIISDILESDSNLTPFTNTWGWGNWNFSWDQNCWTF